MDRINSVKKNSPISGMTIHSWLHLILYNFHYAGAFLRNRSYVYASYGSNQPATETSLAKVLIEPRR